MKKLQIAHYFAMCIAQDCIM